MNLDTYPVIEHAGGLSFEFYSEGPKGSIKKVIQYQPLAENIFNLMFGDWEENSGTILDRTRSNNGDRDKILTTVASTVIGFMRKHPHAVILAKGESPGKTRLYQMGIGRNWKVISHLFIVEGWNNGTWELFTPGKNYNAFLLKSE